MKFGGGSFYFESASSGVQSPTSTLMLPAKHSDSRIPIDNPSLVHSALLEVRNADFKFATKYKHSTILDVLRGSKIDLEAHFSSIKSESTPKRTKHPCDPQSS